MNLRRCALALALVWMSFLVTACGGSDGEVIRCDSSICTLPPPALCQDAWNTVRYAEAGFCTGRGCIYPSELEACLYGCDLATGLCREEPLEEPDPCVCPEDEVRCDGDVLLGVYYVGCREDFSCIELRQEQDCDAFGRVCEEGACVPPPEEEEGA